MLFRFCPTSRKKPWRLERVPGDGDCLIWALLRCLVTADLLPEAVWSNELRRRAAVRSCRQALIKLPSEDPLRPKLRDLHTNCIDAGASDAAHNAAYLQFDVHGHFVLEYLLTEFEGTLPAAGIRCLCYTRFDDILGQAESVTLLAEDANALELTVYNWTLDGFCGTHYDAVLPGRMATPPSQNSRRPPPESSADAVVPPPPQPHSAQRPQKRMRFKQSVEETPAAPEASAQSHFASSPQLLHEAASEDFYRRSMCSPMEGYGETPSRLESYMYDAVASACDPRGGFRRRPLLDIHIYIYIYI